VSAALEPAAPRRRGIELYYLAATPVFFLLDTVWGISVRAAFLDGWPAARYAYYGVCFGCGILAAKVPAKARLIGMAESSANIICLIFSVMVTYYDTVDKVANGDLSGSPFGPQYAMNLVFAAGMLALSYFRSGAPA
jgi:hypothetical protein